MYKQLKTTPRLPDTAPVRLPVRYSYTIFLASGQKLSDDVAAHSFQGAYKTLCIILRRQQQNGQKIRGFQLNPM